MNNSNSRFLTRSVNCVWVSMMPFRAAKFALDSISLESRLSMIRGSLNPTRSSNSGKVVSVFLRLFIALNFPKDTCNVMSISRIKPSKLTWVILFMLQRDDKAQTWANRPNSYCRLRKVVRWVPLELSVTWTENNSILFKILISHWMQLIWVKSKSLDKVNLYANHATLWFLSLLLFQNIF